MLHCKAWYQQLSSVEIGGLSVGLSFMTKKLYTTIFQKIWLYMTKQKWLSENICLLYKQALPAIDISKNGKFISLKYCGKVANFLENRFLPNLAPSGKPGLTSDKYLV